MALSCSVSARCLFAVLACLVLGMWTSSVVAAPDFEDFAELELEDLLDQTVVTASRSEQPVRESSMAITVINHDQILRSGATSVPELLESVPGLEVMATAAGGFDVSARGMAENGANTMLVMIDGRSVYTDYYGLTLWEFLPVDMAEIESIEVIRGPGSALYGANAFAGVINIRTRAPEAIDGTVGHLGGGSPEVRSGGIVHAGVRGNLAYRASMGAQDLQPRLDRDGGDATDIVRLNGQVEYRSPARGRFALSAGHVNGMTEALPTTMTRGIDFDGYIQYLRGDWQKDGFQVRAFWNRSRMDMIASELGTGDIGVHDLDEDVQDVEFQHRVEAGKGHAIVWGASYRHKSATWEGATQDVDQHLYAVFAQDEWHLADKWRWTTGLRYDHHPLVGDQFAPRMGLVFSPTDAHVLRASAGVAHRNPNYLENYWSTSAVLVPGFPVNVSGDPNSDAENIRSLELSYQGVLRDDLMVGMSVYANRLRDLIELEITDRYASPPAPFPGMPRTVLFQNARGIDAQGIEAEIRKKIGERWQTDLVISYVQATDAETGDEAPGTTSHRASLGLSYDGGGALWASVRGRYVGSSTWFFEQGGQTTSGDAGDYLTADLRLGWRLFASGSQFVLVARNLFDRHFKDYPIGYANERRLNASVVVGF